MEPTLYTDNILITERISVRRRQIDRGDIIIAKSPTNPIQHVCKRVIGLPGDKILVHPTFNINPFGNKKLYSKKSTVDESADEDLLIEDSEFQYKNSKLKSGEFVVPRGYVWIEGDNAENSSDSRFYGPIPIGLVRSRAVCRLWPLSDAKMLT